MATPLSNLKLLSLNSHTYSRCPLPNKPFCASKISSRRRIECFASFASRMRTQTTSPNATIFSEDKKEEEDEVEEDGEEFMPLQEMARWLRNKPAGFGEGMRYDTAAEDKLLEEIKQDRKDRVERSNKPRASEKVIEVRKTDPEVRVWNLPKKKNIDRDLWKAFNGFHGIISINPAVTGNRKTKDPICRGFAFIGFESDDAAYRFVQKYSKQNLLFGKVQKQISCDVINVHGVLNSPESSKSTNSTSGDEIFISNALDISKSANGIEPNKKEFSVFPSDRNISLSDNEDEVNEVLQLNTSMLNKKKTAKRVKKKPPKSSKGHILGSLAKLKIKDRAVLTGVFSKYGEVSSVGLKEI